MQATSAAGPAVRPTGVEGGRAKCDRLVRGAMEVVVLAVVALSPWAVGGVEAPALFALYAGVALVTLLWAVRVLLQGRLTWKKCPVTLCLAGLFLVGAWQVVPLPRNVLGWLSPSTLRMYDRLLPEQQEVLPDGANRAAPPFRPGSTLSLYPGATQRELVNLLALFLLFAAVRNNLTSVAAFRRLAAVAVANGALLAFFALVQFFTAPHNVVYWTFPTDGEVFGPFICRNHFPFYVNLCVGLGVGLFLSSSTGWPRLGSSEALAGASKTPPRPTVASQRSPFGQAATDLVQSPRQLWIGIALAFMVGATVLSLSRGGVLALLCAAALCLALMVWKSPRPSWLVSAGLVAIPALLLVCWFSLGRVEARLATVWHAKTLRENRVPLWARVLPLTRDYPLLGTGYGTFDDVEPLTRTTGEDANYHWEHAHNEYLEALIEGGLARLLVSLLALGAALTLGYRAFARHAGDPAGALALGGLFALLTLAVQSFVDFGLHVPAIAILGAVLAAHICALGAERPGTAEARGPSRARPASRRCEPADSHRPRTGLTPVSSTSGQYAVRLGGIAPLLAVAASLALSTALVARGWREAQTWTMRREAARLRLGPTIADQEESVALLDAAAALAPESARLPAQAAEVRMQVFQEKSSRLTQAGMLLDVIDAVGSCAPMSTAGCGSPVALTSVPSWLAGAAVRRDMLAERQRALVGRYVLPALRNLLRARDGCPLLTKAQLQLALQRPYLVKGDLRRVYFERARFLAPDDAEIWYLSGLEELFAGDAAQAHAFLRRSLELSDRYLPEVVALLGGSSPSREAFEDVLPPHSAVWVTAAYQLYPEGRAEERRPFLEKALALLRERGDSRTAEEWRTEGTLDRSLARPAEATDAYQRALDMEPGNLGWRCELAAVLCEQGRLEEAGRELRFVLAVEPGHGEARSLLEQVSREMAEKR